jgi:peptidoglycan/LPS O-acetylase OafA/YrhL
MKYFRQLDGLRAIAIIFVMVAHWMHGGIKIDIIKNLPYGTGVHLFFVISGFLITKILLDFREKNATEGRSQFRSILSFYIRRSLRIFPIYYLTILILVIIGFTDIDTMLPWLLTYTTNIYLTMQNNYIGSYTHFWSLAVEEQFYLFWGFAAVFISRDYLKGTILTLSFLSVLFLLYTKLYTGYWLANALMISQLYTLGLGALIAYYFKYRPGFIENLNLSLIKGITLIVALFFIIIFVFQKPDPMWENMKVYKEPAATLLYFFIVLIAVKNGFKGLAKKFLENRVMVYIGKISYGLYVYHLFMGPLFFNFLNHYLKIKTSDFGYFLIFFAMNMIIATISWYMFEKPINGLKKYFNY